LVGVSDPTRVIFTLNATGALNLALQGLLAPGDHVVTTSVEHNSVMRPLHALVGRGVSVSVMPCAPDGTLDPALVAAHLRSNTRLIVVNHASNVCGTVLPIRELGAVAHAHGILLLVDAAQTAGCWPLDVHADGIDLLAFSGHKSLLGPPGTGGLVIREDFDSDRILPLVSGGTGSRSEDEAQPDCLPDKYEAGTPNGLGLAGLAAGARYVLDRGLSRVRAAERALTERLLAGLRAVPGVRVLGSQNAEKQTAVVSFTVAGQSVSTVAGRLDDEFGILCRPGLHCAPRAHRTLGTWPEGTVRFSPGLFSSNPEIDEAVAAVARLAAGP
jgi:cysteine desulfurase/selenocysteine lyase